MRNGMSVREIYDALDERDRLRECLKEERRKREMLEHHIHNACWKLTCVCGNYRRIAIWRWPNEKLKNLHSKH